MRKQKQRLKTKTKTPFACVKRATGEGLCEWITRGVTGVLGGLGLCCQNKDGQILDQEFEDARDLNARD